jgi:lysine 2,3-aminomutase
LEETVTGPGESEDPLNEEEQSPVPGIVHRYPDRVLFLVTDYCSTFLPVLHEIEDGWPWRSPVLQSRSWKRAIEYIHEHPEVRDVLISGGDPLTLPDRLLEWLLDRVRAIPHVEIIRIGTRVPVFLPQRITPELVAMLSKYHPLWINIQSTGKPMVNAVTSVWRKAISPMLITHRRSSTNTPASGAINMLPIEFNQIGSVRINSPYSPCLA